MLSPSVSELDTIKMKEVQAFIALPHVLENPAESQFRGSLYGGFRYGGITSGPDAVFYMLHTYLRNADHQV